MIPAPKGTVVRFSTATAGAIMKAHMKIHHEWLVPGTVGVVCSDEFQCTPGGGRNIPVQFFIRPSSIVYVPDECLFILKPLE